MTQHMKTSSTRNALVHTNCSKRYPSKWPKYTSTKCVLSFSKLLLSVSVRKRFARTGRHSSEYWNYPWRICEVDQFETWRRQVLQRNESADAVRVAGERVDYESRVRLMVSKSHHLLMFRNAWEEHKLGKPKEKLKVYSTQDWVMTGLLEAFGVFQHILKTGPKRDPGFNSLVVMELWEVDGKPVVKYYYKPEEVTQENHKMNDLTNIVKNCSGSECPLEVWLGFINSLQMIFSGVHGLLPNASYENGANRRRMRIK